ncbi:MAG TPA: ribosome maturation factor RimM [Steroidobacteraceae bacterium]|nr:ribosome maturation factor RimM [Steroidobacteraceae bacterium]
MTDAAGPPGDPGDRMVILGRLGAPWGVKGWIKVNSYTDPPAALLDYPVWQVASPNGSWQSVTVRTGRVHGPGRRLVVQLDGVGSPEDARRYVSREVGLRRSQLPPPGPGEYYWDDLVGCRVVTVDGVELGVVSHFHEFPGNPVMVVVGGGREHWVPLVPRHLKRVDLAARQLLVAWDPEP